MGALTLLGRRKSKDDSGFERREPLPLGHWFLMALITCLAFAIRYWFNFLDSHINTYNACDASEYLRNAGAIAEAIKLPATFWPDSWTVLTGTASSSTVNHLQTELAPLAALRASGPIFPLFIAWTYVLAASPFSVDNWSAPILSQSMLSSITCLFIGLTASRAYGKGSGYLAGLLAAVYPAFVINSGRLYSETFAAFLLSATCYITVHNFGEEQSLGSFFGSSFVNGFVAACLQFTRSVMVVLTLALLPITLLQQGIKKGILGLIGLAIGFAFVAVPWLAFQKVSVGTQSLVVDRVGHYNFFVGNNIESLGWLSVPYPDGRGIDEKPLTQLAQEAYEHSPSHWWSLLLDKPLRLFLFPWNDFRTPLGQIGFKTQVIWHQIYLVLAAIGISLGFVATGSGRTDDYEYERRRYRGNNMTAAKFFLLFVFLLHGIYLFFITVPRYNLTSMVVLLIFAGAGAGCLFKLLKANNGITSALSIVLASCFVIVIGRLPFVNVAATLFGGEQASTGLVIGRILTTLSLLGVATALMTAISAYEHPKGGGAARGTLIARLSVVALTIMLLPTFLLSANAGGRWYEWQAPIYNGTGITQTFNLPVGFSQETAGRQLYLMVDADSAWQLAGVSVSVDGTKLNAPIIPSLSLGHEFDRFQSTGQGQMREVEWVFQNLTQAAGIGAADLRQWFIYPIPTQLVAGKTSVKVQLKSEPAAYANLYGAYATSSTSVQVPSLSTSSWEKAFYGVESDRGLSDTRFNTRIKSLAATAFDSDLSSEPGVQSGRYNIHLLAGPTVTFKPANFVMNPSTVTDYQPILNRQLPMQAVTDAQRQSTLLEADLPPYAKNDLWVVRVSGEVRHDGGNAKLAVVVKGAGQDRSKDYISPWTSHEPINDQWRHFDSSVPLQPAALPSPPQALNIEFWIQPTAASNGAAQFRNVNLEIARLPANPLQAGYVIY